MNTLENKDQDLKAVFTKITEKENKIKYARSLANNANTIFYKEIYNHKADVMEEENKIFIKGYKKLLEKYSELLNNN